MTRAMLALDVYVDGVFSQFGLFLQLSLHPLRHLAFLLLNHQLSPNT
jgi:hypothetical protein